MRIKRNYTSKWRICLYGSAGFNLYAATYHPDWYIQMKNHSLETNYANLNYEDFKRREQWRWSEYLKKWDPYDYLGGGIESIGNLSSSVTDKLIFGKQKWEDPPSFDREADDYIQLAESSGIDPGQNMLIQIQKVVDAYYPIDLDDNPDSTRVIIEPKIEWTHGADDYEEIVEENELKPHAGSIARYLWTIPGYREYFEELRELARAEEEEIVTNMDREQRLVWYERMDELMKRWGHELNDYTPLLAYRWDRKLKLANYLMSRDDDEKRKELVDILMEPGGIKQVFIRAGVITPEYDDYSAS